jgi:hypothetical protein
MSKEYKDFPKYERKFFYVDETTEIKCFRCNKVYIPTVTDINQKRPSVYIASCPLCRDKFKGYALACKLRKEQRSNSA